MKMGSVAAAAVAAKTARACDICVRKRARWYCAADDAFLCQACDDSVHSANPLARRHDRLRLNTAASLIKRTEQLPMWHRGPTKKPRTPRHKKKPQQQPDQQQHPVVPELDTCSTSMDEEEEQLLYRVPVYDQYDHPTDFDVAEFAADVEALLGKGLDGDHGCGIEELGLFLNSQNFHERREDEVREEEMELGLGEPFELTFDYDSPIAVRNDDIKVVTEMVGGGDEERKEGKVLLRLDYDAISRAWGSHGLPWVNGDRPKLDSWPLAMTTEGCGIEVNPYGEATIRGGDGGREARVSRYREKRRTRLFSKKIRYEVRKLNAEKRPRMKGRFVKRSLLAK